MPIPAIPRTLPIEEVIKLTLLPVETVEGSSFKTPFVIAPLRVKLVLNALRA
jgi:hypothetical protein